jgi:hypothetical protein
MLYICILSNKLDLNQAICVSHNIGRKSRYFVQPRIFFYEKSSFIIILDLFYFLKSQITHHVVI